MRTLPELLELVVLIDQLLHTEKKLISKLILGVVYKASH